MEYASKLIPLLSSGLPEAPIVRLDGYPSPRSLAELQASGQPNLCFLDVASDPQHALSTIDPLLAAKPDMRLVVLLESAEPDLILQCLRRGASEFLTQPFSAEQVEQVLDKLCRADPALRKKPGRVTTVIPAKGACGATTIATNLAVHFKKLAGGPVLLADLDPLTGTISFQLKLKSTYSFLDALLHMEAMDADIWNGLTTESHGVDVLLPPADPIEGAQAAADAGPVIDFARSMYDHLVLDVGSIYGDWTVSIARKSDQILVVSTSELPALQAAMRGLDYLESCGVPREKVKLLINRYSQGAGLSKEMIETALHTEVFHLIPSDYETVQKALMEGDVIPTSTLCGRSLLSLSEKLLEKDSAKARPDTPAKAPAEGLLANLGRWFRSLQRK